MAEQTKTPTSGSGKGKRKLMPFRNRTVDSHTDVDETPEKIDVSCPYDDQSKSTPKRTRQRTQSTTKKETQQTLTKDESGLLAVKRTSLHQKLKSPGVFQEKPLTPCTQPSWVRSQGRVLKRTIVCTRMHRKESQFVSEAVNKLGGWEIEKKVSSHTTHVVCGDEKRTVNLLRAIAHGCWILHYDWISHSVQAGQWLSEEPFEMKLMFPGIRQCRIARETFGSRCNIFRNGDTYYVAPQTRPPRSQLKNLLQLCGAKIVSSPRKTTVLITPVSAANLSYLPLPGTILVNEQWVLDSIVQNMLQPKERYEPIP